MPGPCTAASRQECVFHGLEHWHVDGIRSSVVEVGWSPLPVEPRSVARPRGPRSAPVVPPPLPTPGAELLQSLLVDDPGQDDVAGWGAQARGWEAMARLCAARAQRAAVGVETALHLAEVEAGVLKAAEVESLAATCLSTELQCSEVAAQRRLDTARSLVDRLPGTWAQLAAGQVSVGVALTVVELTDGLAAETVDAVERALWPAQVGRTPGQVRRALRRVVARLAPEALESAVAQARERRRVEIDSDPLGGGSTITVAGDTLTQHQVWADLRTLAGPTRAGDERSLDQRMYDELALAVRAAADLRRQSSDASPAWTDRCGVQLTIDAPTLLGLAAEPAVIQTAGAGEAQLPAAQARQAARSAIEAGLPVDRLLLEDWTGTVLDTRRVHGPGRTRSGPEEERQPRRRRTYRPSRRLQRHLSARDPRCIAPTCERPSRECDQDHHDPFDGGGPTDGRNMGPGCRSHHRFKQHPLVLMRTVLTQEDVPVRVWVMPTGSVVPTTPPDRR